MFGLGRKKPAMARAPMPAPAPPMTGMVGTDVSQQGILSRPDQMELPEQPSMPLQDPRTMGDDPNKMPIFDPAAQAGQGPMAQAPAGNPQDIASQVAQGQPIQGPPAPNVQTAQGGTLGFLGGMIPGTLGALNTPPAIGQNFAGTLAARGGGYTGGMGGAVGQTGQGNAWGSPMPPAGGMGAAAGGAMGAMRGMFGGGGRPGGGMGRLGDLMTKRRMQQQQPAQPMGQLAGPGASGNLYGQ